MRLFLRSSVVAAVALSVAAACSSFGGDSPVEGGDAAVESGPAGDAAPPTPDAASDGKADVGADGGLPDGTLAADNFDDRVNDCSPWDPQYGNAFAAPDAGPNGSTACRICVTTGAPGASIVRKGSYVGLGGYALTFDLRADSPDAGGVPWNAYIVGGLDGGLVTLQQASGALPLAYEHEQAAKTITQPYDSIAFQIFVSGQPGDCAVLDNVLVTFQP